MAEKLNVVEQGGKVITYKVVEKNKVNSSALKEVFFIDMIFLLFSFCHLHFSSKMFLLVIPLTSNSLLNNNSRRISWGNFRSILEADYNN